MMISKVFDFLVILFGIGAAIYWYKSASIRLIEQIDGGNVEGVSDTPDLIDSLKIQGQYNKTAAPYACFGAAAQILSSAGRFF